MATSLPAAAKLFAPPPRRSRASRYWQTDCPTKDIVERSFY